jgi:uncharacterized caspase-like protein/TRAP-type C4-dicarboxylate transport system substrate-binding protein
LKVQSLTRILLFLLGALLLAAGPDHASAQRNLQAQPAPGERRVALVIGNGAYKSDPLRNAVNDANDMARELERVGFKVILRRDADQRAMRQAVREFGNELRRASVGLFFYAGHGLQVRGANYLVPVGADIQNEADAEDLSLDATYVLRTMEEAQVQVSIVILDACRNNPFARSFRSGTRGLAQMTAATGSLIAFATAPGSVAADGSGRNGTYTKHLLASLRADDTDVLKVFQRVRANVVKETGGRQTPWESTSLIGDFYFRPPAQPVAGAAPAATPAPPPAAPIDADALFWSSIRDSSHAADYEAYLARFPSGQFSQLARNRLRQLAEKAPPAQLAVAIPSVPAPAPGAPGFGPALRWDLPSAYSDATFHTQNLAAFAQELGRSGAGLDISVHSNGSLIRHPDILRAVSTGQVNIAEFLLAQFGAEDPALTADNLPFVAMGYDEAWRFYQAQKPLLEKALHRRGLRLLYAVAWPGQGFYTNAPLRTIDDLKGIRMRTYSPLTARLAELLGAAPTVVPVPEVPRMFSSGALHAMLTSSATGAATRAWEFTKHYYRTNAFHPKNAVVVNERAFQRLPQGKRQALLDAARRAETRGWEMSRSSEQSADAQLRANGMAVHELDEPMRSALRRVGAQMLAEWASAAGPDASAMVAAYGAR